MFSAALFTGVLLLQSASTPASCDAARGTALAGQARRDIAERQFDRALAKLDEALKACPENIDLLLDKAQALLMARRLVDARGVAEGILRVDAGNGSALKIKANAEYFVGEYPQAVNTLITLLERHPDDYDGAYMLGRIYYQEGYIDQAIGQFERVLRINQGFYKAWDNLALCWQALGEHEKAIAHFLRAIKLVEKEHPEYDWAYANLADLLLQTGDAQAAFAAASKAANRNPNSARNFYIGAKALDRLGKSELCLNWLQRAAALDPTYSEAQYMLARVYQRLGQSDKAEEARKRFTELKAKEPNRRR